MITIEALAAYGADTQAGLARCMGMKDFYLRLVNMELNDQNFDKLSAAMAALRKACAYAQSNVGVGHLCGALRTIL